MRSRSSIHQRLLFTDKFFRFCWRALVGLYIVRVYYQTQGFSRHVTWKMRRSTESNRILHNASHSKPQIMAHPVKRWIDYPAHSPLGIEGGVPQEAQDTGSCSNNSAIRQSGRFRDTASCMYSRLWTTLPSSTRGPTTPRSETRGGLPPAPG